MKTRGDSFISARAIVTAALTAAIAFAVGFPCAAEGPTQPPNPILPPTLSRPDVPSVSPPAPPTVSGVAPGVPGVPGAPGAPGVPGARDSASRENSAREPANAKARGDTTTASALSMLGLGSDNALLKALSGAAGGEEGTDALSSLLGGKGTTALQTSDDETLKKILDLLEKQESRASSGEAKPSAPTATPVAPITSGGELIRLSVNGYSVLPSVTTIVSSVMARDGSFLITGDRAYSLSGRYATETFYLLCRKTGPASYRLFADVTQGLPNERSIPWRLSRITPIEGSLTGDLLVFRTTDPEWRLDLVIRVVSPTVHGRTGR